MRALVTGGAGFVGSALVDRLLAEGHSVDVVDDLTSGTLANLAEARAGGQDLRFTKLDVASPDLPAVVSRSGAEVVYHLATPPGTEASAARPVDDARAVVIGGLAVLEAARQAGVGKVVVALSPAVYGIASRAKLPVRESQPLRPTTPRGVAEAAVAAYLAAYRDLHDLEYTALVLADVYGPRQDPHRSALTASGIAVRLRAGLPVALPGAGTVGRDLVFVDDAVDALARAADRGGGLLVNVGSGRSTTAAELYAAVAAAVGSDAPAVGGATPPGEPARMALDASRAGMQLGWRPWTSLGEGVEATLAALPA